MGTRERILDVAEALIARHGMEGLRLKDVAERVGIQPPSVFAHFEGRDAIGDGVAQRVLAQIARVLEAALEGGEPPEVRLRRAARAVAEHLFDHPGHTRLILRDLARTRTGSEIELWSPDTERIGERVEALLGEGREAGAFRELPPGAFLPLLEGAIVASIGWAGFREDGQPATTASREAIVDRVEDLAWAYVRADGRPGPGAR
ncbi:MAG: TetR/AcrR family transcriptional regulator [Myxococcales bacterium]|nr:TetR/AcrR family transcriptional regulator [Myxococcales bacterium]